jgi:hypothetical protein
MNGKRLLVVGVCVACGLACLRLAHPRRAGKQPAAGTAPRARTAAVLGWRALSVLALGAAVLVMAVEFLSWFGPGD